MTTTIKDLQQNNGGYYDRTESANYADKHYDKHVFIAGRILQSSEMNEIQSNAQTQLRQIADALFKDGDIVRDARCVVSATGNATLEAGAVYAKGQVRGVPRRDFIVPTTGTQIIGLWLVTDVVTDADDPTLLDPATGNRGFNEPGSYRLRVVPQWGLGTDNLANGEFFPVYYVDDGNLRAKEPPPNLDSVTQAIARYDVDSNGSNYIISGMRVSRLDDHNGDQVYSIASGRARVNGFGINLPAARRVTFTPNIDLKSVINELHKAPAPDATTGIQTIPVGYPPIHKATMPVVKVLKSVALTMTRAQSGATDRLTNAQGSVTRLLKISDSTNTYVDGRDYSYDPNTQQILWYKAQPNPSTPIPAGAISPAGGSDYDVDAYASQPQVPTNITDTSFDVKDVVVDPNERTTVWVDYSYRLPRIDRLVVDENGQFDWIRGVATDLNPAAPPVPGNLLSICEVNQAWTSTPSDTVLVNDGVRMVSMSTLENMNNRLDKITDLVAQINLISDINVRDAGKKKGLFVDPFVNDSQRDQSRAYSQTLAITGGALQLAIKGVPMEPVPTATAPGVKGVTSCDYQDEVILGNTARTSTMKVNPYMAFAPFPAQVTITPSIDRWVDTRTNWSGPETRYFTIVEYAPWTLGNVHGQTQETGRMTTNELVGTNTAEMEYLRATNIRFSITGFKVGEALTQVLFDGVDVTATVTP
ncbi:DUF4815 domain-containing protein [Salmonella enterica]|nr:DUF4815 domain-containing protein [Salmonella enterica]